MKEHGPEPCPDKIRGDFSFVLKLDRLKDTLLKHLTDLRTSNLPQEFYRVEIPLETINLLGWLTMQDAPTKIYWQDRTDSCEIAGIGTAMCITESSTKSPAQILDVLHTHLAEAPVGVRFYGGTCFDPSAPLTSTWESFGVSRFILPRFEIVRTPQNYLFACNLTNADLTYHFDRILSGIERLNLEEAAKLHLPICASSNDVPDQAAWKTSIEEALDAIQRGALSKVVLARVREYVCSDLLDPIAIMRFLGPSAAQTYRYCFQIGPHEGFLGASPERLFRRKGHLIQSEAIAGTRPRGASTDADTALTDQLLMDDKERREHTFVVDSIRSAFDALCKVMHSDTAVSVVRLRDCQHLHYHFEGAAHDTVTDTDILSALHPTPAVGGEPTDPAIAWIREHERVPRGWYAGPIGWVGRDETEFAVAIRCARITGRRVSVYAGAGIVAGSDPMQEWNEIEDKMAAFSRMLRRSGSCDSSER